MNDIVAGFLPWVWFSPFAALLPFAIGVVIYMTVDMVSEHTGWGRGQPALVRTILAVLLLVLPTFLIAPIVYTSILHLQKTVIDYLQLATTVFIWSAVLPTPALYLWAFLTASWTKFWRWLGPRRWLPPRDRVASSAKASPRLGPTHARKGVWKAGDWPMRP